MALIPTRSPLHPEGPTTDQLYATIRATTEATIRALIPSLPESLRPNELAYFVAHSSSPWFAELQMAGATAAPDDCVALVVDRTRTPGASVAPPGHVGMIIAIGSDSWGGLVDLTHHVTS